VPLVYSLDRVRRLRLVLAVDLLAGLLLVVLAVLILTTDDGLRGFGAAVAGAGTLVAALAAFALRALPGRDGRAKAGAAVAGGLTVLVGFLFARNILGFAMILIGIVLLALAMLRDDPDLVA
jgi:hypothetical protein